MNLRAGLDKSPRDVAAMFDQTARRYDVMNDVLSVGFTRGWRRATVAALALAPGEQVLDIAAGTATSSVPLAAQGAQVVAADFSLGMLRVGQARNPQVPKVAADATKLPFADASFDAVTMSFGLRNVADTVGALRELARVTRPGGRIVVCEFSRPLHPVLRSLYLDVFMRGFPPVARTLSSNPDSYVYLSESIAQWHPQESLAGLMAEAGWCDPAWRNLTGGIVALHRAHRPC